MSCLRAPQTQGKRRRLCFSGFLLKWSWSTHFLQPIGVGTFRLNGTQHLGDNFPLLCVIKISAFWFNYIWPDLMSRAFYFISSRCVTEVVLWNSINYLVTCGWGLTGAWLTSLNLVKDGGLGLYDQWSLAFWCMVGETLVWILKQT